MIETYFAATACSHRLTYACGWTPSAERARLEREGRARLYRYLAGREVRTATSRRNGLAAARYLWKYMRLAPFGVENLRHAAIQLVRGAK